MAYRIPDTAALKQRLQKAERSSRLASLTLVLPLLLFLVLTFVAPIGLVLYNSVHDDAMEGIMPKSAALLRDWNPSLSPLPEPAVRDTVATEMVAAAKSREISRLASRVNYDSPGMRGLLMSTARALTAQDAQSPSFAGMVQGDERWSTTAPWAALKRVSNPFTANYYLNAVDLRRDDMGDVVAQPQDLRLYRGVALRTLVISFLVAGLSLLLGFPLAYLLAHLPPRISNMLMVLVLLPFWTSLLVRTMAWVVILQPEGLINSALQNLHIISNPLPLVFNRFGVLISMVHILMPYMVLTLYSVMKGIPAGYVRAARSLGAGPVVAFLRVYLPQTYPGVFAGSLLVFILALGFYITPAIVGGSQDQMLSYFIADHMNSSLNWGLATALGGILLAGVMILFVIYARLTLSKGVTR